MSQTPAPNTYVPGQSPAILTPFIGAHPAPALFQTDTEIRLNAIAKLRQAARASTAHTRDAIGEAASAPTIMAIAKACTACSELMQILTALHNLTADPYWAHLTSLWRRISRHQQTALHTFATHEESIAQHAARDDEQPPAMQTIRTATSAANQLAASSPSP